MVDLRVLASHGKRLLAAMLKVSAAGRSAHSESSIDLPPRDTDLI